MCSKGGTYHRSSQVASSLVHSKARRVVETGDGEGLGYGRGLGLLGNLGKV
jgi:hypothetical protein